MDCKTNQVNSTGDKHDTCIKIKSDAQSTENEEYIEDAGVQVAVTIFNKYLWGKTKNIVANKPS